MNYISLFSGIEAASVAWGPLGFEPVAFSEISDFPSAVLAHHYPSIPNVGDITKHDWLQYRGQIDVVVGGPPCQAFSIAGLRQSMDDARGNLSLEYVRAVEAIQPRFTVTENVPGWLSTRDNAFGCFLGAIVGADAPLVHPGGGKWSNAGMVIGPRRAAAWRILDAQYFGLAQRRKRVFVVCCPRGGANPAAILFERKSVQGHTPPRRGERAGLATGFEVGPSGGNFTDLAPTMDSRAKDGPIRNQLGLGVMVTSVDITNVSEGGDLSGTLESAQSKGNKGQGVLVGANNHGERDVSTSLSGSNQRLDGDTETFVVHENKSSNLTSEGHERALRSGASHSYQFVIKGAAIGRTPEAGPQRGEILEDGSCYTLDATDVHAVAAPLAARFDGSEDGTGRANQIGASMQVRRLTTVECARLQGFPDCYLDIMFKGKPAADGSKYKALGNSFAVSVVRWIGEQIARVDE